MMQFAHVRLAEVNGMQFYKLMGSGKGLGFNPFPDWSVYAMLQVWDSEQDARQFFKQHTLMDDYRARTQETGTFFMKNLASHGKWSGQEPFLKGDNRLEENKPIAVITRATIKNSQLIRFWKYVPTAQRPIAQAKGLLYTKGIGEVPIKQMATFSLWDSLGSVKDYAYNSKEHATAITMTKQYDWYSEELFARFQVVDMLGSWGDIKIRTADLD